MHPGRYFQNTKPKAHVHLCGQEVPSGVPDGVPDGVPLVITNNFCEKVFSQALSTFHNFVFPGESLPQAILR